MRIASILFIAGLSSMSCMAQVSSVRWDAYISKRTHAGIEVTLRAIVQSGWYLYSQHLHGNGPMSTRIQFDDQPGMTLQGMPVERGRAETFPGAGYAKDITWFTGVIDFVQRIHVQDTAMGFSGSIQFMTCNRDLCIPGHYVFSIPGLIQDSLAFKKKRG